MVTVGWHCTINRRVKGACTSMYSSSWSCSSRRFLSSSPLSWKVHPPTPKGLDCLVMCSLFFSLFVLVNCSCRDCVHHMDNVLSLCCHTSPGNLVTAPGFFLLVCGYQHRGFLAVHFGLYTNMVARLLAWALAIALIPCGSNLSCHAAPVPTAYE